jgi:hypothetical protein
VSEKKNILVTIRDQEMDRKSFLKLSGLVILSAIGARSIISILTPESLKKVVDQNQSKGFGSGKYGA